MLFKNILPTKNKQKIADLALKVFGPHNTLNALSAFALSLELNWPEHLVLQGLASFAGVKRRQEVIGKVCEATIIEDFAHHPTAVSLTIDSMHEQFPGKKVLAVFEPRSATSRRNVFEAEYIKALSKADLVLLPPAFNQDKIAEGARFSAQRVINGLINNNIAAELCSDVDEIVEEVCKYYKVTRDDILISKRGHFNEPRNVSIYLSRCIRNDTLKGVGDAFGIVKNSTVGSVVARVKREMEKNESIGKRVKSLKDILGKS